MILPKSCTKEVARKLQLSDNDGEDEDEEDDTESEENETDVDEIDADNTIEAECAVNEYHHERDLKLLSLANVKLVNG